MQPNKKLLAKKRKAQQEAVQKQNEKRQIAEASNTAPEGITARMNQQRKALVTKSKTSSSSAHHQVQNASSNKERLSAASLKKRQEQQIGSDSDADDDDHDDVEDREMSLSQQHQKDDDATGKNVATENKSNAGFSTATTTVVNRLATLLDAPADGRAFFALSSKIGHEEQALSGAKKMSAKRRTRLEIAERDGDDGVDEVDGDDDDDDEANEMRSTQKTFNKNKKILEVVDDVGPIAPAKRDELKKKKQQMLEQQQQKNKTRGKNDDAADDDDDDDDDNMEKKDEEGMKLLKTALRNQNHKKLLPHQDRPDYEYRLRRIATSGCVRLFNALAQAQTAGAEAANEAQKDLIQEKAESHKIVASREAFMSALRGAASSARK